MNNLPEVNTEMPPQLMSMEVGNASAANKIKPKPDNYREESSMKRHCFEETGTLEDPKMNLGSYEEKPIHEGFKATSNEFYEGLTSLTQEWYSDMKQIEGEHETAITRLTKLTAASKQLNDGFKQQLDGLHGSVVRIMSSFKC